MRLLIVTPYLSPVYGGTSTVIRALAEETGKQGVDIDIITTNASGAGVLDVPLSRWVSEDHYRVKYFSCFHRDDFIVSPSLLASLWREVGNYDVAHTHTVFAPLINAAQWICRWRKTPYVSTPHGMLEPWALANKKNKKAPYFRLIERPALAKASALHALAQEEKANIETLGLSSPTFVLPNGISLDEFASIPPRHMFDQAFPDAKGKRLILFMGRIDPKKGIDLLVKSFAVCSRGFPADSLKLVIAGPDLIGYRATIEQLVKEEGIENQVIFTGMLEGSVKLAALSAAEMFVLPSWSEGFSMAVLEALAAGCPVVITRGCNFPLVSEVGAGYVVDADVTKIIDTISELLNDPQSGRAMGERGRMLVQERFSWAVIAKRLIEIYQDILTGERESSVWLRSREQAAS